MLFLCNPLSLNLSLYWRIFFISAILGTHASCVQYFVNQSRCRHPKLSPANAAHRMRAYPGNFISATRFSIAAIFHFWKRFCIAAIFCIGAFFHGNDKTRVHGITLSPVDPYTFSPYSATRRRHTPSLCRQVVRWFPSPPCKVNRKTLMRSIGLWLRLTAETVSHPAQESDKDSLAS